MTVSDGKTTWQFPQFSAVTKTTSSLLPLKSNPVQAQPHISEILRFPVLFGTKMKSLKWRISNAIIPSHCCSQSAHSHDGLHWEDVSSSCEDLPGREEHMCIFEVVRLTGGGVGLTGGGVARVWQSVPWLRGLVVVGPGIPVTRSGYGAEHRLQPDRRPPFPPAHVEEEPQLLAEGGIQTAVDERVVAGGAHRQPVKAEVQGVGRVDGLAGQQHNIAVEWEPADGEHPDHQEQHGQRPPPLSSLGGVLSRCGVTDGVVAPQPAGHCGVGGGDDEERQHVK